MLPVGNSPVDSMVAPQSAFVYAPAADAPTAWNERVADPASPETSSAVETLAESASATTEAKLKPELPPKPRSARYETLDIFRGMACLMLMVFHATFYAEHSWVSGDPSTWTPSGLAINLVGRLWIGVPIFFVVSGYCIAASVDSLRRKPHSLPNYFYRRLRRIYPPLWGGLVFAVAFSLIVGLNATLLENCLQLPRLQNLNPTDWLANFSATTSWLPSTLGSQGSYLLANTWTLCYEEQFYFVAGLLLTFSSRKFFAACYFIALATLVMKHAGRYYGIPIGGYFFDGHWLLFVCGILVYQQINYLRGAPAKWAMLAMTLGAVHGLAERVLAADPDQRHFGEYLLVACLFGMLLSFIKRWDKMLVQHWSLAPFRWSGKMSYSLYLIHFPITVFTASVLATAGLTSDRDVLLVTIPVCLILSFPMACVFYQLVERHFINQPSDVSGVKA